LILRYWTPGRRWSRNSIPSLSYTRCTDRSGLSRGGGEGATTEKKFCESLGPIEALQAWMLLFVDYIATKQIIGPALNSLVGGPL
jgi:hypothetical protein